MNRIRRIGRGYQVLVSPHQKYNAGFEYLLGSWTDDSIIGFEVHDYGNLRDAECEAIEYPDINWDQLVEYHKDSYIFLRDHLQRLLENIDMVVEFKHNLMTPEQTKNTMFNRVRKGQKLLAEKQTTAGFRTVYDMNDIISFRIINPWTKNLVELATHLMADARLRIFKRVNKNGTVMLVGRTDIGTTYEITLITSIFDNLFEWRQRNKTESTDIQESLFNDCIYSQKLIDDNSLVR